MIKLTNIKKTYRGTSQPAVDGLSLEVEEGQLVTLLGSSGCGKTTTLRCLAGLEEPDAGEITIDGETVYSSQRGINLPASRRRLGMVFQSYAIWPHMTVFENVAFPLRCEGKPQPEVDEAVHWALSLVNLDEYAQRRAPLLSGGQQQRVALARAVVNRPRVLLLDEPLSNLDAKLRDQMRLELRQLLKGLKITAVYVTHDQDEAYSLSDVTALMNGGRIVEYGLPIDIYARPKTAFGAEFLGLFTKFEGTVVRTCSPQQVNVKSPLGEITCQCHDSLPEGSKVDVYLRPEEIDVLARGDENSFDVSVTEIIRLGSIVEWWGESGGVRVRGRMLAGTPGAIRLQESGVGSVVPVLVTSARCLPADAS
ncbi:MAG: ABC transporter ATP-binding protein [Proteobacteria bacterium]|nr:MAG: ABC transporter ATP-binding protein [Pseudomonadota bacterium]